MLVNKPVLPPRRGYVERVNELGEHYYSPPPETRREWEEEAERNALQNDADALAIDHEYRLTLLELGVF